MLDTVLEIGRALRDPDNREKGLIHHRYVERCPMGEDDDVLRLRIPVTQNWQIDLDGIEVIQNEQLIEKLFYLKYKSADADTFVKYIFGDIYYTQKKGEGEPPGNYRLGDPENGNSLRQKGSFHRGSKSSKKDAQEIADRESSLVSSASSYSVVEEFRSSLSRNVDMFLKTIDLIERLLKYQSGIREMIDQEGSIDQLALLDESTLQFATAKRTFADVKSASRYAKRRFRSILGDPEPEWKNVKESDSALEALANYASGNIFLHFDLAGKHWYEHESAMQAIDQQFVSKFAETVTEGGYSGSVLRKYIYKTMISSHQLPNFDPAKQNRIRLFSDDELINLFYAINMAKKAKYRSADVKVVVLPRGEGMTAADVTRFMQGARSLEEAEEQEGEFKADAENEKDASIDDLLDSILADTTDNIVEFDLVFSEADSRGQDADLVELAGVSSSFLQQVRQRIGRIRRRTEAEYRMATGYELEGLTNYRAFRALLSGVGQDQPRYQRHLYRMLPKIYTETYYQDPLLLPSLIDQIEKEVRDGDFPKKEFNRLNHFFKFLTRIQNTNPEGKHLMSIRESLSFQIGRPLGKMAHPINWNVKSFEKNYVGNLRRRIATIDDLVEFKNEIEEMLIRHEHAYREEVQEARSTLNKLLAEQDEHTRLDKNRCALGFFESYFEPFREEGEADDG
jgi:hypothetical protein